MVINMGESQLRAIEQIKQFISASANITRICPIRQPKPQYYSAKPSAHRRNWCEIACI